MWPYTPGVIANLCDADYYTISGFAQMGRDVFTIADFIADLEEMN